MRLTTAACLAAAVAAQAGPWDAELVLLSDATIKQFNARCLDGSAPGFYYRAGDPNRWKWHIQGGGWCTSASDCLARAKTARGSSTTWPQWLSETPDGFYGLMDANATTVNPFGDWSFMWLTYCDGASATSNRAEPLVVNGTPLYFRGAAILDAIIYELERLYGFTSNATEVIVSGTSAGGLSTYLHADYVKAQLTAPGGARVVAVPDAGFFLSHAFYGTNGDYKWYNEVAAAIGPGLWNSTFVGAGAACWAAESPAGNGARCFFPQWLYKYMSGVDGVFILQSTYDTANLGICYGLGCNLTAPGSCSPAEAAAITAYADDLRGNVTGVVAASFPGRDSYFLTSCFQHEESCRAVDWYGITINGQTPNSTFYNWYTTGVGPNARRVDGPWPSDASCAPPGYYHGSC